MKQKKVHIEYLVIEVTRRCTMCCAHCLRGEPQNVDIKHEYITRFLESVCSAHVVYFTGGEPSMNVEAIRYTLEEMKRLNIPVDHFYIATNGSRYSLAEEFIEVCRQFYDYQDEKLRDPQKPDFFMLTLSQDEFHDVSLHKQVVSRLSKLPFFSVIHKDYSQGVLLKEGRSSAGVEHGCREWRRDEDNCIWGYVYLNALGYLVPDECLSFESQHRNKVCHCTEFIQYLDYAKCSG